MSEQSQFSWDNAQWLKQAREWIETEVQRQSIRITGTIQQPRLYPWAIILHVPTDVGTLFFKASADETIYEAALLRLLSGWFPDCMPELLAADTSRGWMLMRDGGEQLRSSIRATRDLALCRPILAKYAEVQVGLTGHVSELLAVGVPDYRLPSAVFGG